MSQVFDKHPLHTIFRHFPLSKYAFEDCVEQFPLSSLSRLDDQGRLPLHEALMSPDDNNVKCSKVVSALARRAPESLLLPDPVTGMYPFEIAALILSTEEDNEFDGNATDWFNAVFGLLRGSPVALLHAAARWGQITHDSSSIESACSGSVAEYGGGIKKQKTSHERES